MDGLAPSYLVALLPGDGWKLPLPGRCVRWPGEDVLWIWAGTGWIARRLVFDGGDAWLQGEDEAAA